MTNKAHITDKTTIFEIKSFTSGNELVNLKPLTPAEKKREKRRQYLHDWRDRRYAQGLTARGTKRKLFDDDPRVIVNMKKRRK